MSKRTILNSKKLDLSLKRLSYQLVEGHNDFSESVLIGLQPRGIYVAQRIHKILEKITKNKILIGELDVTFYRDDIRRRDDLLLPNETQLDFSLENKNVILIDDVLYTGRTVRSGLDAMLSFGRPKSVEFLTLINRRYQREIPIQPDYIGKDIDTIEGERVSVLWKETDNVDRVILYTPKS